MASGTAERPDAIREQLVTALGSAYTLERELGGGGMSRVFVAEDVRLGRRVVVKVLAPELTEGMSAERFEREVRLAARLQHPNIVPVLASGERGGLAYYIMPYVEGESLRHRLSREGRLPIDAAVSVLRDVARALEYAHAHGVVHRDVKPDNILLTGSAAAVADFGIAKALDSARTAAAPGRAGTSGHAAGVPETLTRVGTSLGTPAYMAPEQAAGDPNVDARADVYAWGVVAYELLAGAPPFVGRAAHQLIAAHIGEPPPPLAVRAPELPVALTALVMRCLEKDPAKRPQSATDVLASLEVARTPSGALPAPEALPGSARVTPRRRRLRVAAAALLVVALVLAAGVIAARAHRPAAHAPPVLAVLPFENLGPPGDAYFADGLTEEVRGRLARVSGLQVIGGTSARLYKGSTKSPREIAHELGATHLLMGKVRWERAPDGVGRVRVSPELVRAADQASVWAESVEGPLTVDDVFAMQARVAERVAAALDVTLLAHERRAVATRPTANLAAYDAYLRGLAHAEETNLDYPTERHAAIAELQRAVALDPRFAAAHARLALAYLLERYFSSDTGLLARARASAERATALDSTLVDARLARALVIEASGDPAGASRVLQALAQDAPSNAEVYDNLGYEQAQLAHPERAIPSLERAALLEPRWSRPPGDLAGVYDDLSRYEEAIHARERELLLASDFVGARIYQASSYLLWRGDTAAARRVLERGDPRQVVDVLTRRLSWPAGRAIWLRVVPPAVLAAKDTLTLAGFSRGGEGSPELFHLMKARHFALTGRADRARAHADSLIALAEPQLRREPGAGTTGVFGAGALDLVLAEAYGYTGRAADAARAVDQYVEARRRDTTVTSARRLASSLVSAAYVDAWIGRRDLAVARLAEALRLHRGQLISRALLRADPSWAPLRGHPGFERLIAGG